MPGFMTKIAGFVITYAEWAASGLPMREPAWIAEIFDQHCAKCEHYAPNDRNELFQNGICRECGCHVSRMPELFNKIALPNTRCPLTPPKWDRSVEGDDDEPQTPQVNR